MKVKRKMGALENRLDDDFQAPGQPVQKWDQKEGASGFAVVWDMRVPGNLWPGRQNCEKTIKITNRGLATYWAIILFESRL